MSASSPTGFRMARHALLLPLLIAACDTMTEPELNPTSGVVPTVQAAVTTTTPVTCANIKAAHPGAPNGNYAVRSADGNTFVAWCQGLSAYITIPQNGVDQNYATWSGSHDLYTRYSKLQIDLTNLRVSTTDRTFATSSNVPVFGPGAYVYAMNFASPADCRHDNSHTGRGNVDFSGTPFALNAYFSAEGWVPRGSVNGRVVGWDERYLVTAKIANLTGGGYCGQLIPWIEGDPLFVHNWLQLRFDGAQLASPAVTLTGSTNVIEGEAATLSATASHPAAVPFWTSWDLGDGTTGTGAMPTSHVYAQHGTYTVTFTATDDATAPAASTMTITVTNPAPAVAPLADATIFEGETYSASGSFSDPVVEAHSATVNYGGGEVALALTGNAFSLSNTYASAGVFDVTVVVTDEDGFSGSSSATVTVLSAAQASEAVAEQIQEMLPANDAKPLVESLNGVAAALASGNVTAAQGKLGAFDNKTDALLRSGKIDAATHAQLKELSRRIRRSM